MYYVPVKKQEKFSKGYKYPLPVKTGFLKGLGLGVVKTGFLKGLGLGVFNFCLFLGMTEISSIIRCFMARPLLLNFLMLLLAPGTGKDVFI